MTCSELIRNAKLRGKNINIPSHVTSGTVLLCISFPYTELSHLFFHHNPLLMQLYGLQNIFSSLGSMVQGFYASYPVSLMVSI